MRAVSEHANLVMKIKPFISRTSPHSFPAWPPRSTPDFAAASLSSVPPFRPPSSAPLHPPGEFAAGRCRVRGCVYPARPTGMCLDHQRQAQEPRFFHSHQPTLLVLDQARFAVPEAEPENTRTQDRRRLAAAREAFLEEAA